VTATNKIINGFVANLLNDAVLQYNRPDFIPLDPISIPHSLHNQQDKEIIGFWVAMLSWGRRSSIVASGLKLLDLMDGRPHHFIMNHKSGDLKRFETFVHRTFQATDALYFIHWFRWFYARHHSLESAFTGGTEYKEENTGPALNHFHRLFFSLSEAPQRTKKHVSLAMKTSTCKRLNMFLRWMIRKDNCGVDFGLWNQIKPHQLLIPLDVHVDKVARKLGLINRKQSDWKTVVELTNTLKLLDETDPVKYDYALFGLGVLGEPIDFV